MLLENMQPPTKVVCVLVLYFFHLETFAQAFLDSQRLINDYMESDLQRALKRPLKFRVIFIPLWSTVGFIPKLNVTFQREKPVPLLMKWYNYETSLSAKSEPAHMS